MENKNEAEIPVVYADGSPDIIARIDAPVNSNIELWQAVLDKVPVADIIDSNKDKQDFIRQHLTIMNNVCQAIYNVAIKPIQKLQKYPYTYNTMEAKWKFIEGASRNPEINELTKRILSGDENFPEHIWTMAKPDNEIFYEVGGDEIKQ